MHDFIHQHTCDVVQSLAHYTINSIFSLASYSSYATAHAYLSCRQAHQIHSIIEKNMCFFSYFSRVQKPNVVIVVPRKIAGASFLSLTVERGGGEYKNRLLCFQFKFKDMH